MSATRRIAIGLGIAGGAILAAWLLTGDRKRKTKDFIAKKTQNLKSALKKEKEMLDDDMHYV